MTRNSIQPLFVIYVTVGLLYDRSTADEVSPYFAPYSWGLEEEDGDVVKELSNMLGRRREFLDQG